MIKQFNGYQIDLAEKILMLDNQEVEIEPLVMDVLVYLIENRDRYIDIQELHESLWVDKIVSDSAIRRTIVKLRSILNDDSSNPTYIKSATRKGYRFICELEDPQAQNQQPIAFEPPLALSQEPIQHQETANHTRVGKSPVFALAGLVFLIASMVFWWLGSRSADKPSDNPALELNLSGNLIDLYGKSLSPALHRSKPLIAFSHKNQRKQFYDLFVFDTQQGSLTQLTNSQYSYLSPVWKGDNQIIAMGVNKDECKIVQFTLLADKKQPQVTELYQCIAGQPNLNYHHQDDALYFSDKHHADQALSLFKLSLASLQHQVFSSPSSSGIGDYISANTVDGTKLAFARSVTGDQTTIFIENLKNGKLIGQMTLDDDILSMYWHDAHRLLLLTSGKLHLFDTKTNQISASEVAKSIIGIHPNHQSPNNPVVVQSNQQKYMLEEIGNPYITGQTNARTISHTSEKLSAVYADSTDDIYYLTHQESSWLLHSDTQKYALPIKQAKTVELLAINASGQNALLRIDNQIALYVFVTEELDYLTKELNQVLHASFTQDGQNVLYAIKQSNSWSVQRFNLLTEQLDTFIEGAIKIKNYEHGYAAVMANQQLALIKPDGSISLQPDIYIPTDFNTSWAVIEDHVYYTTQSQEEINLYRIDLATASQQVKLLDKGSYNGRFSMSADGSKIVRMVEPTFVNTVLKAQLTFN